MVNGLLGKKIGMTQVFDEAGKVTPVTVLQAGPCYVIGKMASPNRVRIGFEPVKENHTTQPLRGVFKKAQTQCLRFIKEVTADDASQLKDGQEIKVDVFNAGDFVDVVGVSIGKGFQGGMKRWNWRGGPRSHGSTSHRRIGSAGSSANPSRIWKGQHMPGHMGACRVTQQSLKVVKTDIENNLILVRGAVPGHTNGVLFIRRAKKKQKIAAAK